ncbi:hypothetical protein BN3658_00988 [Coriobacteriaceae bacterium CHKCI002]|nr:hypothetical protein BN3658_00988 [Coriobacteriaceae bacterium CHKCI002]
MAEQNDYTYCLPNENNEEESHTTSVNSLIIIGANGSGKSKLGAWIEQQDPENVHRVGAQRSLNFSEHVPLKSYEESEGEFFYGSTDKNYWNGQKDFRWEWGKSYTTKLIDDFDAVLSALLARQRNETQCYFDSCREAEDSEREKPHTPITSLDRLESVWQEVFPHRNLKETDSKFIAVFDHADGSQEYPATQMSDGERAVLYLAAQVLCIPNDKTIIVDEPEVHLHPSLMGRLWRALETARPDCFFIFVTHDIQFASAHGTSDKVWVKSHDGEKWCWEFIPESDLPEQLLLELLGNRKNVLFVEGGQDSLDVQLYSTLYPEYYIVPCGGCSQVIANTKAFASTSRLHELRAYGIIDRDYRSDEELDALEKKGIYSLKVAEVENLFLVEPLLRILVKHFACQDTENAIREIKDHIIKERFAGQIERQICQATIASLKTQLTSIEISGNSDEAISANFKQKIADLSPTDEFNRQSSLFKTALDEENYESVLALFNEKGLAKSIGHFFKIDNKAYCTKVITLLKGDGSRELVEAFEQYIPKLPS